MARWLRSRIGVIAVTLACAVVSAAVVRWLCQRELYRVGMSLDDLRRERGQPEWESTAPFGRGSDEWGRIMRPLAERHSGTVLMVYTDFVSNIPFCRKATIVYLRHGVVTRVVPVTRG